MSSFFPYQNMFTIRKSEKTLRSIEVSPAIVSYVESISGRRVVGIESCLDADGYRFALADGDFIIIAAIEIERLERAFGDHGRMSRNQFEKMVMMQKQEIDPLSRNDIYPEFRDGTTEAFLGQSFDMCIEDELGEAPESGADRFHRSLRKVYWHRYLKKHEQK
jgi:hypothetical protein